MSVSLQRVPSTTHVSGCPAGPAQVEALKLIAAPAACRSRKQASLLPGQRCAVPGIRHAHPAPLLKRNQDPDTPHRLHIIAGMVAAAGRHPPAAHAPRGAPRARTRPRALPRRAGAPPCSPPDPPGGAGARRRAGGGPALRPHAALCARPWRPELHAAASAHAAGAARPRARAAPLTTACAAAPLGVGACKARQGPNFACVFHTTMLLRRAQPACAGSRGRRAHQSSAAQAGRPPEVVACATMDSISSTVCIDVGTPRCTRRSLSSRLPGARLVRNLRAHAARRRALDAHSRGSRRARARSLRAGRYATGGAHQGCRMISGMVIRRFGSGVSMLRSSARQSSLTRRGCS